MDIEAGTVIAGRYRVVASLRPEGAGHVYAVDRVDDGRRMALKVLRNDLRLLASSAARLRLEAQIIEAIDSDHLIRGLAYDPGDDLAPSWRWSCSVASPSSPASSAPAASPSPTSTR